MSTVKKLDEELDDHDFSGMGDWFGGTALAEIWEKVVKFFKRKESK